MVNAKMRNRRDRRLAITKLPTVADGDRVDEAPCPEEGTHVSQLHAQESLIVFLFLSFSFFFLSFSFPSSLPFSSFPPFLLSFLAPFLLLLVTHLVKKGLAKRGLLSGEEEDEVRPSLSALSVFCLFCLLLRF